MKTSQWRRTVENRCVFSARRKALSNRPGDRSAGGRRFHVDKFSLNVWQSKEQSTRFL